MFLIAEVEDKHNTNYFKLEALREAVERLEANGTKIEVEEPDEPEYGINDRETLKIVKIYPYAKKIYAEQRQLAKLINRSYHLENFCKSAFWCANNRPPETPYSLVYLDVVTFSTKSLISQEELASDGGWLC